MVYYFILIWGKTFTSMYFLKVIEDRVLECYGQNYSQSLPIADPSVPDSAYLELTEVLGEEQLQKVRI